MSLIALALTGALVANILWAPAGTSDGKASVLLSLLIAGILGFDLYGRRNGPPAADETPRAQQWECETCGRRFASGYALGVHEHTDHRGRGDA